MTVYAHRLLDSWTSPEYVTAIFQYLTPARLPGDFLQMASSVLKPCSWEVLGREFLKVGIIGKSRYIVRGSLGVYRIDMSLPDARVPWVKLATTSNLLCRLYEDICSINIMFATVCPIYDIHKENCHMYAGQATGT